MITEITNAQLVAWMLGVLKNKVTSAQILMTNRTMLQWH